MRIIPINTGSQSDQELLKKYRESGERAYLGALYKRYMHLVYGLCLKYLKTREESQDAVMDIFERISGILMRDEIVYFKSWLYAVSKNHCLVQLRKHKDLVTIDENFMEIDHFEHHNNEADIMDNRVPHLEKCMEELKESQKKCLDLFFKENKSYAQVSEVTKYSLKQVKSYIQNGKRNLKNCIEQQHVEG